MADIFTKEKRSRIMSSIRSKNTKVELKMKKALRKSRISFRMHPKIIGNPDFILPKGKIAVFVDGCFWHRCPRHYIKPSSNVKFWKEKIRNNVARDKKKYALLKGKGWKVLRFWEHEINEELENCMDKIVGEMDKN